MSKRYTLYHPADPERDPIIVRKKGEGYEYLEYRDHYGQEYWKTLPFSNDDVEQQIEQFEQYKFTVFDLSPSHKMAWKRDLNQAIACNHDGIYFSDGEPHCDDCGY